MSVNLKAEIDLLSLSCKHGFEQNRAEERQEKEKACFNVGVNFPEKHAFLDCIYNALFPLSRALFNHIN